MKNHYKLLLLFLGLFMTLYSCQKDYPKDIPKWLKEKIKEREKVCKKEGCSCSAWGGGCWTIFEWDKEGETYFLLDHGWSDVSDLIFVTIFDDDGTEVCKGYYDRYIFVASSEEAHRSVCSGFLNQGNRVRLIWEN